MALFRRFTRKKSQAPEVGQPSSTTASSAPVSSKGISNGTSATPTTKDPSKAMPPASNSQGMALYTTKPMTNGTQVNGASHDIPEEPSDDEKEHKTTRKDVEDAFSQFASLIHASRRPLPNETGDGQYLDKEQSSGLLADLKKMGYRDVKAVIDAIGDGTSGKLQDDRKMHMEELMQLVAALPDKSANRVNLTGVLIEKLWSSLQHPPMSYLGDDFKYRSGDGSNNSYIFPKLGAANTPYARSVNPMIIQPGALPDTGLIFDSVMAREKFIPHPNKVSSIFFNWASLIIHDLFQTDHHDYSISKTSSYLDLSILYGDTQEDQDQMRTFKDGKIKPDCFSEERLLAFPPSCGTMLILLNRWHNYIVEQLALINEGGRFNKPADYWPEEKKAQLWKKYDNDLFQTGRLVTCGLYINITLYDYLRTIVNLNRTNSTWTLDPRLHKDKEFANDGTPRGVGNQVSAEFSLSYRWHSCIGQMDEEWTKMVYKELMGKAPEEVGLAELMQKLGKIDEAMPKDPMARPFGHLKRGPDGKFNDDDLAKIMESGINEVSGAFGARNIPKALRVISMLGMEQARKWQCGSLNEFRKFFGLKTYDTFEEINPDPYVAEQLRNLYEHPDFVELYPGIATEAAKEPMVPGVGIAPTYTVSRAVLSDAVALVRGDRFYTLDYNPKNLTNWGYNEVQYDLSINQGCIFYKLLLRGLPNHFKADSIYAHYPMTIPEENAKIMKNLGRYHDYSWETPSLIPLRVNLSSYNAAQYVLNRAQEFNVMWTEPSGHVLGKGGLDFCLSGDTDFHKKQRATMTRALYKDKWHLHVKHFYEWVTLRLLHEKSCKIAGINQVDLTRDVGNLAHVHFSANVFALPLKSEENPSGLFTEQELYMIVAVIFTAIFFDFEPTKSFQLRMVAHKLSMMLGKVIEANVKFTSATGFAAKLTDGFRENKNALAEYGIHMVRQLIDSGLSAHEIAFSQILPTACAMIPNQAQVFTQIMDYYLGEGAPHWAEIHKLAMVDTPENDDKLLHYAMEGIRLNGTFGSYRRSTVSTTINDNGEDVAIKPGDKVFVSFVSAARDPTVFPDPDTVKADRPMESYIHYGIGEHTCLGKEASMVALTAMLRTVGKLENLRRAPGPQGQLKKIPRPGGFYVYMREDHGSYFVFPMTMKVHYDGVLPPLSKAVKEH